MSTALQMWPVLLSVLVLGAVCRSSLAQQLPLLCDTVKPVKRPCSAPRYSDVGMRRSRRQPFGRPMEAPSGRRRRA